MLSASEQPEGRSRVSETMRSRWRDPSRSPLQLVVTNIQDQIRNRLPRSPRWIQAYFRLRSKWPFILGSIVLVTLIGVSDYVAGPEYSLLLLYLVPILHASWFAGRLAGILVSFACSLAWLISHEMASPAPLDLFRAVWNLFSRLGIFLVINLLISWQQSLYESLQREKELASRDSLTGALNGRGFRKLVERERKRARRYGHPFSIAFIDLDDFKAVNDRAGHDTGDRLLHAFVKAVRANLRATDQIGRIGGDEFALLLPETSGKAALEAVSRIRAKTLETLRRQGFEITASYGLATYQSSQESVREHLGKADALMYEAKQLGKDRIQHRIFD